MAKPKNYEEALSQIESLKEKLAEQKQAVREFKTENKVKRGKEPEDAKVAASLKKLDDAVEATRESIEELKTLAKEMKPRKERKLKYEYPEDCVTDKQKKAYRTKMRKERAKAAAGESSDEKKKPAPKKKPVKKAAAEPEDED